MGTNGLSKDPGNNAGLGLLVDRVGVLRQHRTLYGEEWPRLCSEFRPQRSEILQIIAMW